MQTETRWKNAVSKFKISATECTAMSNGTGDAGRELD